MPLLSIIVTSYNVKDYIGDCIRNLIDQTIKDIEIIVVDDGSTDGSADIIRELAAKDPRIIPVLQETNSVGGVATPANIGLEMASGTFVGFADGDDIYDPAMFGKLVDAAVSEDCALAMCNYYLTDSLTGDLTDPADERRWKDFSGIKSVKLDEKSRKKFLQFIAVPWRKVYRRSLLEENQIRFPVGDFFFEDNPFHWATIIKSNSIALVPEKLCKHRVNRVGQTMDSGSRQLFGIFAHHEIIETWLKKEGVYPNYRDLLLRWTIAQIEWTSKKCGKENWPEFFSLLYPIVNSYSKKNIKYVIHRYKIGSRGSKLLVFIKLNDYKTFSRILDGRIELKYRKNIHFNYFKNGAVDAVAVAIRPLKLKKKRKIKQPLSSNRSNDELDKVLVGISMLEKKLIAIDRKVQLIEKKISEN